MAILDFIPWQLKIAFTLFLVVIMLILIIKSRYRKFTNREFVLFFRNGSIKQEGYGGAYFLLPFIDELIVLSTTVQNLEVDAGEVITKENQDVRVNGFVVWRIESPREAYSSITGSQASAGVMNEINKVLSRLVESIVRTTVARLTLDQVLRERGLIIDAIMAELVSVVGPMGIKINTAEIRHVEVVDQQLFNDLQESYRQTAKLDAEKIKISTDQEIQKSQAFSAQQVRLYKAEQEELSRVRELEKDRTVLIEEQRLNETEQQRMKKVQELAKERELSVAKIDKDKLEVESKTNLMQIEYQARSLKAKTVLEEVEVESERRRLLAAAEAEQRRLIAEAEADAIRAKAHAEMEAIELAAKAEAFRLSQIADAKKKSMLAEAEGKKAILVAEAEGLREKVEAQGLVNEAMILQELVKQLPAIASSMKVGDINWLNMGGGGKEGDTPLGIIPKNLLQLMTLSKSFGLDLQGLIESIRGKTNGHGPELNPAMLQNAVPVMDGDVIIGFDLDGDGEPDIDIPEAMRDKTLDELMSIM